MKRVTMWTVACVFLLLAARASAQEPAFGDPGHVAISAERLFGYVHAKRTITIGGMDMNASEDSVSLLANPLGFASGYGWPRIGIDAFVIRGLSVGGALGFFYLSPDGGGTNTIFMVAPRIGYAATVAPRLAIWPRLGFTYWHLSSDPDSGSGGSSSTSSAFALTVEVPVVIQVVPRVAFLIGPALDLGLGGSASAPTGGSVDQKYTDIAVHAGILVFL